MDYEGGSGHTPSLHRHKDRQAAGGGDHGDTSGGGGGRTEADVTGKEVGSRNSHTLTEKEVEIGFQKMEKHNGK